MCKTQKQIADICIYKCLDVCVKLFMNVNLVVLFLAPSIYTFPPCKLFYTPPTILSPDNIQGGRGQGRVGGSVGVSGMLSVWICTLFGRITKIKRDKRDVTLLTTRQEILNCLAIDIKAWIKGTSYVITLLIW